MNGWIKKWAVLAAALAGFATASFAGDAPVWKLLPQVQVDGAGVFLDQVATLGDTSNTLPHLLLTRAPQSGKSFSFSREQVAAMAVVGTTDAPATNWDGADTVRVTRRMRAFDEVEMTEMLTAALQKDYIKNQGELELSLTRPWMTISVPDDARTVKIGEFPTRGLAPATLLTFELWAGKEKVGSWPASIHASVWRDIPVARSALERGQPVKDADITMERADVLISRDAFLNFPTANEMLEFTENVPAGRPVLNRMVRIRPLIQRGQLVEGIFQDGALGISLMVETMEDGTLGQLVRVRNPKTKRELYGKVESEKSVRINL